MTRPDYDEYFLNIAAAVATRGTCRRRKVGCILVNEVGQILATGYNGPPRGFPHCIDKHCSGYKMASGQGGCDAIHAEANALLQCPDVTKIAVTFITAAPCKRCVKLLLNTSCHKIVFSELSPNHKDAEKLWLQGSRILVQA